MAEIKEVKENIELSESGRFKIGPTGDVVETDTNRKIELPEFKELGLNVDLLPKLEEPQIAPQAPTPTDTTPAVEAQPVVQSQFIQFAGSPDIFEKSTGQRITEEQAIQARLFTEIPGQLSANVQILNTPRPGITTEQQFSDLSSQPLTEQELISIGFGKAINPEEVPPIDEALAGEDPFANYLAAIATAKAATSAATEKLAEFQLLDTAEIKEIAIDPNFTKRLAARRISFINDPQSALWLQRIALQNEVNGARAGELAALQDLELGMKMFELAKPDLISEKINDEGHLIQFYSNPMNPSEITPVDLGGGFGGPGKVVNSIQVDDGVNRKIFTTIQEKDGTIRYEETIIAPTAIKVTTDDNGNSVPLTIPLPKRVQIGINQDGSPIFGSMVSETQLEEHLAATLRLALTKGFELASATERGKVEGAVSVIQLGEELKALLAGGDVKTGPISGTFRSGPAGAADIGAQAIAGAGAGAAIGSVVPGVGTVIGGAAGGALGVVSGFVTNIPGTQALGTTSEDYNEFFAKASQITSAYGKSISGAAIAEQEFERLSATTPSVYAQETVNTQRIEALQDAARRTILNFTNVKITL